MAVKQSTGYLGLEQHRLHKSHVGSHSLRAGGAMAMHLNGISDNTIKKMGRWSSDTFLMYIHEQILAFSKGISQKCILHNVHTYLTMMKVFFHWLWRFRPWNDTASLKHTVQHMIHGPTHPIGMVSWRILFSLELTSNSNIYGYFWRNATKNPQ